MPRHSASRVAGIGSGGDGAARDGALMAAMIGHHAVDATLRQFLLGALDDQERLAVEARLVADPATFEALALAEGALAEAYVDGELSPEDRQRFERHYLTTTERCRQVTVLRLVRDRARTGFRAPRPMPAASLVPPVAAASSRRLTPARRADAARSPATTPGRWAGPVSVCDARQYSTSMRLNGRAAGHSTGESPSWVLSSRSVASGWPRRSTASCCARPGWPVARPVSRSAASRCPRRRNRRWAIGREFGRARLAARVVREQ